MSERTMVALLRGINVGARRKVPMADLRRVASSLGLGDVVTHIQSGNLVFTADLDEETVATSLEEGIQTRFGFEVPVVVRSETAFASVAADHPLARYESDPRRLMVAFLDAIPEEPVEAVIDGAAFEPDRFIGEGREVYLAYPDGLGRSKLTHALLEKRLGVRATIRNWNTVQKVAALAANASN